MGRRYEWRQVADALIGTGNLRVRAVSSAIRNIRRLDLKGWIGRRPNYPDGRRTDLSRPAGGTGHRIVTLALKVRFPVKDLPKLHVCTGSGAFVVPLSNEVGETFEVVRERLVVQAGRPLAGKGEVAPFQWAPRIPGWRGAVAVSGVRTEPRIRGGRPVIFWLAHPAPSDASARLRLSLIPARLWRETQSRFSYRKRPRCPWSRCS
jgi:hypothetical protein